MFTRDHLIYLSDPLWAYGAIKIIKNLNKKSNLQLFSCKFQKWPRPICFLAVPLFFSKKFIVYVSIFLLFLYFSNGYETLIL